MDIRKKVHQTKQKIKKTLKDFVKDESGFTSRENIVMVGMTTLAFLGMLPEQAQAGHWNGIVHTSGIRKAGCGEQAGYFDWGCKPLGAGWNWLYGPGIRPVDYPNVLKGATQTSPGCFDLALDHIKTVRYDDAASQLPNEWMYMTWNCDPITGVCSDSGSLGVPTHFSYPNVFYCPAPGDCNPLAHFVHVSTIGKAEATHNSSCVDTPPYNPNNYNWF